MFVVDAKSLGRIAPTVRRVLIVDPNLASARLIMDIVKGLGSHELVCEADEERALASALEIEPGLVFIERAGPRLDGEAFARRLRRSDMTCRRAPIIMVSADATASSIKGARDAGVHEFLRKPFTAADLFRRIENVATKPRPWVEAVGYVGPDRRRFNSGEYQGPRKRRADAALTAEAEAAAVRDQALRILKAALLQFDVDPAQAVRAMQEQAKTLKAVAISTGDANMAIAASDLDAVMQDDRPLTLEMLDGPVRALLLQAEPTPAAQRLAG